MTNNKITSESVCANPYFATKMPLIHLQRDPKAFLSRSAIGATDSSASLISG